MAPPPLPTIVLLGPRGVGKTRLGRLLARRLDRRFVDLDDVVRGRFGGASVAEIWRTAGEPAWRQAESHSLIELIDLIQRVQPVQPGQGGGVTSASSPLVIALGGGAPMVAGVQETLGAARTSGRIVTVLLMAPLATLRRRLGRRSSQRPSLTGEAPADEIKTVLDARLPTYRALSDCEVDLAERSPSRAVDAIISALAAATHSARAVDQERSSDPLRPTSNRRRHAP